jgi:WD40 repeat protein
VLDEGALPVTAPNRVDLSPDGRHAAVGAESGEVFVLDLETGAPVRPPVAGHDGVILTLAYSADGRHLLSSGIDYGVAVWEGTTGRLVSRLVAPEPQITSAFGADADSVVISPEFGGPVYAWDTSVQSAVDFACRAAGRDFTEAEWRQQFGSRPYEPTCPDE